MIQDRSLNVLVDGAPAADGCHIRLRGKTTVSLYPDLFLLNIRNLSDAGFYSLGNATDLQVYHGSELIAFGEIAEVNRWEAVEGELTTVSFGAGLSFWESFVSLSVPAGSSASETVRRILAASISGNMAVTTGGNGTTGFDVAGGTGFSAGNAPQLLNWPGTDPVFIRGQAFYGRAADAVAVVLSAIGARAVLVPAGVQIIPAGGTFEEKAFVLDNHDGPWIMESRTVSTGGRSFCAV